MALHMDSVSRDRDARGVLHHRTLALQIVLVDGTLLLLLHAVLVVTALVCIAVLPDTRVAHHTWKTKRALLMTPSCCGSGGPPCAAGWPEKSEFPFCD